VAIYTQAEIDQLIACPKMVTEPPAKELKLEGANYRNDARLIASDDTKGAFSVFIRKNADFPENFSIGLIYSPNDGIRQEINLLRCNGKHGVCNRGDPNHPHWNYHIHRASEAALEAGEAAEKYAVTTAEFASLEEAVQYFVKAVNVNPLDVSKHFPKGVQTEFDFNAE
jgi:hypothetical protein